MLTQDDKKLLKEVFLDKFNFSDEDKEKIVKNCTFKDFKKGELIYFKYDCIGYMIVKNGSLRAFVSSKNFKEISIFTLHSHEDCIMCKSCTLGTFETEINLQVEEDSRILLISVDLFKNLKEKYPLLANHALDLIAKRFALTVNVMEQALFSPLIERIRSFLSKKAQNTYIKITHEELANHLGSAREAVSRVLKEMEKKGEIKLKRGEIKLLKN